METTLQNQEHINKNNETFDLREELKNNKNSKKEIHLNIPEGIEIKKNKYGYGLFSTKFFAKDSFIFPAHFYIIPNEDIDLVFVTNQGNFEINSIVHAIQFSETSRLLGLFDDYLNHSCDPNSYSVILENSNIYNTYALRNINPGEEITCDYNTFEYDCKDKGIDNCLCKAENCFKQIYGFKYLPTERQKTMIDFVGRLVLSQMAEDPDNNFFYFPDLKVPVDKVKIAKTENGLGLFACQDYEIGDVIFNSEYVFLPTDAKIVVEANGDYVWLNNSDMDMVDGKIKFLFFDIFMNKSSQFNVTRVFRTSDDFKYEMKAVERIHSGQELFVSFE